jgi:hypothetical protein
MMVKGKGGPCEAKGSSLSVKAIAQFQILGPVGVELFIEKPGVN